jgi:hypothetical protein
VADIDFGDTHGEQLATLMRVVRDLHRDIYGNGNPGLKGKAEAFMSEARGVELEQTRRHRSNSFKLNFLMVMGAIATLIVTIVGIFVTVQLARHSEVTLPKIFHSQQVAPEYAVYQMSDGR